MEGCWDLLDPTVLPEFKASKASRARMVRQDSREMKGRRASKEFKDRLELRETLDLRER